MDKKSNDQAWNPAYSACPTCKKPDIYIILLDGYPGAEELNDLFNFDNTSFLDSLAGKGFKTITRSHSNYNYTPYSTASTLQMEYLDNLQANNVRRTGNKYSLDIINNNNTINFFTKNGYTFYNCSIFQVKNHSSPAKKGSFIPTNSRFITGGTFLSRLEKDVLFNIAAKYRIRWYLERSLYNAYHDNNLLYELTKKIAEENAASQKIIYTHLIMPHPPYYIDERGNLLPFELLDTVALENKKAALAYLKYTNNKTLKLINHILSRSSKPPIIALFSDHGFRHYKVNKENKKYLFSNLMSIYLPGQDYRLFNDSMINVNLFRTILNSEFKQKLPLLEDSTFQIIF